MRVVAWVSHPCQPRQGALFRNPPTVTLSNVHLYFDTTLTTLGSSQHPAYCPTAMRGKTSPYISCTGGSSHFKKIFLLKNMFTSLNCDDWWYIRPLDHFIMLLSKLWDVFFEIVAWNRLTRICPDWKMYLYKLTNVFTGESPCQWSCVIYIPIPHICHLDHLHVGGEEICHG